MADQPKAPVDKPHVDLFFVKSGGGITLAERFGQMLSEAESAFGPRDSWYFVLGVEFWDAGHPQLYHPWITSDAKWVTVRLPRKDAGDYEQTIGHLSQECVHLLAPKAGVPATFLEEGLATWFSVEYMRRHFSKDFAGSLGGLYREAYELAAQLMARWPHAIKNIRNAEPVIGLITREAALGECPGEDNLVDKLLRKW